MSDSREMKNRDRLNLRWPRPQIKLYMTKSRTQKVTLAAMILFELIWRPIDDEAGKRVVLDDLGCVVGSINQPAACKVYIRVC